MAKDDLIFNNTKIIDNRTAYGKGLEQKIDPRTDYGKGIYYKGDDGHEYATPEALAEANRIYWDSMMIDTSHRDIAQQAEVEKARMELERKHEKTGKRAAIEKAQQKNLRKRSIAQNTYKA